MLLVNVPGQLNRFHGWSFLLLFVPFGYDCSRQRIDDIVRPTSLEIDIVQFVIDVPPICFPFDDNAESGEVTIIRLGVSPSNRQGFIGRNRANCRCFHCLTQTTSFAPRSSPPCRSFPLRDLRPYPNRLAQSAGSQCERTTCA